MTSRKRVSVRQVELLVEFLEDHRDLAHGRLKSKEANALSSRLWAQCAGILNSEADGDQRTTKQWNKWFTDYKCRLLSRIRQIKANLSGTGGGPGIPVLISPLEERLAALLCANTEVTGRSGTPQAEVQINPLSPVLHTTASSSAPFTFPPAHVSSPLPFDCGENGQNIINEYEVVVDVAHLPSTQSIESEQVNETLPTRQRTRRRSRLNRQSPPASSELEASRIMLANIETSRIEVERMMAIACQTMAEATNKVAEAALKSAEAQGRIAEALENISKALQDKHA